MKHLSSFYSNDNKRRAEVHRYDELTYMLVTVDEEFVEKRAYYGSSQDAENAAEDFVESA